MGMNYYVKAAQFLLTDGCRQQGYLHIQNGCFGEIVEVLPEGATVVDWSGYTIAPGLFDTHIHGLKGYDVMDGKKESIEEMSTALLEIGVTRFLPTTLTSSREDLERAIIAINKAILLGAQSEGIFLEGPYFTEKYKGAQNPIYFGNPNVAEFRQWQILAEGKIVKLALAPERENAISFIKAIADEVLVSIAHTDAVYERCVEATAAGAKNYVHLFNGMSGLHHREPGVVGAAFVNEDCYTEMICDGNHVHPDVAALTLKIKENQLLLISDCMRAGGMPDGRYHLGEFIATIDKGIARTESGSLAGSTLALVDGVVNLQQWSRRPLYEIWHLASLTPARSLQMDERLGSLCKGKLADYVVYDEQIGVIATAVEGEIKYERQKMGEWQ